MTKHGFLFGKAMGALGWAFWALAVTADAQPNLPIEIGQTVNGFQDDFRDASLNPNWISVGASDIYEVAGGLLKVHSATGDPNHLLYTAPGYDDTVQEVLARIRVRDFGQGDPARGGVGVAVSAASGQGINYHFRDYDSEGQSGRHTSFLDDLRAWGPGYAFTWTNDTWYWIRLRQEPGGASLGGGDVFAKIWPGDGSLPEPAGWQAWSYLSSRPVRTGFAGITAGSSDGISEFEVDYILIKASGLPKIVAAPDAFPLEQTPVNLTLQPQDQTVPERAPATWTVAASGNPPPTFQWSRDGQPLPGQTNASYTISAVSLTDDQARLSVVARNVVSNILCTVTSRVAVLTVRADTQPPALLSAAAMGLTQVQLTFSEPIDPASASNGAHYSVQTDGATIQVGQAGLDSSQTNVLLEVSRLTEGARYTVTVNGLTDQAAARNPIPENSRAAFTAVVYQSRGIGDPIPSGTLTPTADGYDMTGSGAGCSAKLDQFRFSSQLQLGDFDLRVRVADLNAEDPWASAGLMARATLDADSMFVAVLATPSNVGAFFLSRVATGAAAVASGSSPINYPNTWLRLKRTGSQLTGYISRDGQSWQTLGSTSLNLPASVELGFAVAGHANGQSAAASFKDITFGTEGTLSSGPALSEPLAQSSRRTPLVISEIMYHPANQGTNQLEFVELYNAFGTPEDVSGYRLSGDIDYIFPSSTILQGGSYLVVARDASDVAAVYGITNVLGPYTGSLPNNGGTIRLRHRTGAIFLEINYGTAEPWPLAADGLGHALVLARPSYGEDQPQAWAASDAIGGSPGRTDSSGPEPLRSIVINEYRADTSGHLLDYLELYNHSNEPADLSGCLLSNDKDALFVTGAANAFRVPAGVVIPPRGFRVFDRAELGFGLSALGDVLYLANSNLTRVLDAVTIAGQADRTSTGRYPDGGECYPLATPTPGAANGPARVSEVVINEIMYAPISGDSANEYVELYNQGATSVNVGGWSFTDGIQFEFPQTTVIPAPGYLVVAKSVTNLLAHYSGVLTLGNTVGNFGGTLANGGERLVLSWPKPLVTTNAHGGVLTNTVWVEADQVAYRNGGRWAAWAAGGGSSLELLDSRADHRLADNWAASDETAKAAWTTVSAAGKLDNGDVAADELQVLLQGAGECLIDDVEVLNASGVNQIANSSFETGATGWTAEGTEDRSGIENSGGYNGGKCYHVRAVDRGDNQMNRIRVPLKAALPASTPATIRAKVRWLKGHPEILFRLRGKWLEAVGLMDVPPNLGTPGGPNSRRVANAGPAIYSVTHSPVLPAAGEPVIVTAHAQDPDGVASLTLRYRIDPSPTIQTLTMVDDGTGVDAIAGDGVYSATIPGQTAGTLIAFHLQATDGAAVPATTVFPNDAPARECLVRFGESVQPGNMPVYRIWMTQATFNTWSSRHKLNNTPLDITFVLGNYRAIYNAQGMFAGSPYIAPGFSTPAGNRCGYSLILPPDDAFLGSADLVLDWPGGHGNENTGVQEEMAYWIADQLNMPFCLRHYIRLTVNGVTDMQRGGIFEAINQPAGEFVAAWSPNDASGDFYKIDRGFEFSDGGSLLTDPMPRLANYTTTGGVKKTSRYRWNWLKRSYDRADNYTNIFNLVDALNATSPEPYTTATEQLVDVEEWMRVFAFEHIINNFDSWGHEIGKNMYAYKPQNGKWQLYVFDLDWLMLVSPRYSGNYANGNGPLFIGDDPTVVRMYNHPPFRRAYFRAVQDAVAGPLSSANCDPVMDAKYRWLVDNNITLCDGYPLANPATVKKWFSDRRSVLQTQLAAVAADFTLASPSAGLVSSNLVTLTGTAPISVKTITVNGTAYEPVWTTVTTFSLQVPLATLGTNLLRVQGFDLRGQPVSNASAVVTILYQGPAPSPEGLIVLNEILHRPKVPGAEFVELFNASTNFTFDLGGWRLSGLDYTFPPGTLLLPQAYYVLAKDRTAFMTAFPGIIPDDVFAGTLSPDAELLSLIKPGATTADAEVVSQVHYESQPPWPAPALGTGVALQLVDASQGSARAGNWAVSTVVPLATPRAPNSVRQPLPAFPTVWINEVGPENLGILPDHAGELDPWLELYNPSADAVLLDGLYLTKDYASLNQWAFPGGSLGPHAYLAIFADGQPSQSTATELHTSFRLDPGSGALALTRLVAGQPQVVDYLNYSGLRAGLSFGSLPDGQPWNHQAFYYPTPGRANNGASAPVAVYINEWMASNTRTLLDPATGRYDDWFELYNAGLTAADLGGYYLTDDLTNQVKFRIPAGCSIAAGGFLLVWADNPSDSSFDTNGPLHVNFKLAAEGDAIGLFAPDGAVVDTIRFNAQVSDVSEGRAPDGGPTVLPLTTSTPGASNQRAGLRILQFSVSTDGRFGFTWAAETTKTYQVQYKEALAAGDWSNLGAPVVATSPAMTTQDVSPGPNQRFYRILQMP